MQHSMMRAKGKFAEGPKGKLLEHGRSRKISYRRSHQSTLLKGNRCPYLLNF